MRKIILIFILFLIITLLYNSPNPIGVFVAKKNVNTIDSLFIKENGTYFRVIYQKEDGTLLFRNMGQWKYERNRIVFTDFFPNDDTKISKGYNFINTLIIFSVPLERSYGRVVFDFNETSAFYRFYKVFNI